jgi:UDP-2,4-diacetamido-2,4,6-trideoxy-beta-L-altropyranose hydrolase
MRCLTLADSLSDQGCKCTFFCVNCPGSLLDLVSRKGHSLRVMSHSDTLLLDSGDSRRHEPIAIGLEEPSRRDALSTLSAMQCDEIWDWFILDHYGLGLNWEMCMRPRCRHLAVIDDYPDRRHHCDLLINPSLLHQSQVKHSGSFAGARLTLEGPGFAILRPEFDVARRLLDTAASSEFRAPQRILVMFGGDDSGGNTVQALKAIQKLGDNSLCIDVIVSQINLDIDNIYKLCASNELWNLHVNCNTVAAVLSRADFVIASGGTSTWERLYLRKPSLLKVIAHNQERPLSELADHGLITTYRTTEELEEQLQCILLNGVSQTPDIVRNGTNVITRLMINRLVSLDALVPLDLRRTYAWLANDSLRISFLMSGDAPSRRSHFTYWRELLNDSSQEVYAIKYGNTHVGNAGLRGIHCNNDSAEIWLYIGDVALHGNGLGAVALKTLESRAQDLRFNTAYLHVSARNQSAMRLYRRSGYTLAPDQSSATQFLAKFPEVVRMEKVL